MDGANSKYITIGIAIAVILAGFLIWYFGYKYAAPKAAPGANTAATPAAAGGLGSDVYEKSVNPIGDKIPQTATPVPNPIENVYKNPFE